MVLVRLCTSITRDVSPGFGTIGISPAPSRFNSLKSRNREQQLPGPDRANFRAAHSSDGADQEPGTSCSSAVLPIGPRPASSRLRVQRVRDLSPARSTCPHRLDPLQHLPLARSITVRLAIGGDGPRHRTQNSASRGCRCRAPRRYPQRLQPTPSYPCMTTSSRGNVHPT